MINIDGITERQSELLTIMWNIPTLPDLERWINTLDYADARDAETLSMLLIYSNIDQILEGSQDFTQANAILAKIFG